MGALEESVRRVLENYYPNPKDFWGTSSDLSLGAGLVYSEIAYPLLNLESRIFDTAQGSVLVLTHECDIAQENERYFNEELLLCPIIPFQEFFQEYISHVSEGKFQENFVPALSKNQISRVMYLPGVNSDFLPHGGLVYFNQICSTHISMFEGVSPKCAITAPGLNRLSQKLQNHLLRPKSEVLPLTQAYHPSLFYEH